MIDRRELLEEAQKRKLSLAIIEKDYIIGWVLFGFSRIQNLIFKGGTALSKIYFPRMWRLSEDLDFTLVKNNFKEITEELDETFKLIEKESGIKLKLKSKYFNPEYLQLKIQYEGPLGKNWIKIDVTKEKILNKPLEKELLKAYSDYPEFRIQTQTLEEIASEKLRALIQRKKSRDYYDIWRLLKLEIDFKKIREMFMKKCKEKGILFEGTDQIFPKDLADALTPYWERELSRLVSPVPKLDKVITEIKRNLAL